MHEMNKNKELPNITKSTLLRLLHDIGFVYEKRGNRGLFIEKDDIIRWRHDYLRKIKKARSDGKVIVYTDESWVNVGHSPSKVWKDKNVKSAKQAFLSGLSTGLTASLNRGPRFALVHAGSCLLYTSVKIFIQWSNILAHGFQFQCIL